VYREKAAFPSGCKSHSATVQQNRQCHLWVKSGHCDKSAHPPKAEGVGDAGPDKLVATYLDLGVNCLTFDVDQGRDRALL
jgi:hypothetical protein